MIKNIDLNWIKTKLQLMNRTRTLNRIEYKSLDQNGQLWGVSTDEKASQSK